MDLSALIFVALAVAWAVYLVPKALKHHDESDRARTVDRFSQSMRVLARREPVDKRSARLVVTPGRPAAAAVVVPAASAPVAEEPKVVQPVVEEPVRRTPAQVAARRAAAARATRRRRRVLGVISALLAVVTVLCAVSVISWWWVTAPVAVLVAWLVACRLMVRQEQAVRRPLARPAATPAPAAPARSAAPADVEDVDAGPATEEIAVVTDPASPVVAPVLSADVPLDPSLWDPVPVTLPTYVTKPAAARRTVRTIDLDDTGVWTSGRSEADSALAREAEEARSADKARAKREADQRRATGS